MEKGKEEKSKGWKAAPLVSTYLDGIRDGFPLRSTQFEVMLHLIRTAGIEVKKVLDIGAGDGCLSAVVLSEFPGAEAVCVDFSAPMIEAAHARFDGSDNKVSILRADISERSWLVEVGGYAPFDVIVSSYAIHHLSNKRKQALYDEAFDMLAPGGLFVNIDRVSSLTDWGATAAHRYLVGALRTFHKERKTPEIFKRVEAVIDAAHSSESDVLAPVEAQCEWLRHAGFADVDCYLKAFEHVLIAGRR